MMDPSLAHAKHLAERERILAEHAATDPPCCELLKALSSHPTEDQTISYFTSLTQLFHNAINTRNFSPLHGPFFHVSPSFTAEFPVAGQHTKVLGLEEMLAGWREFVERFPEARCLLGDCRVDLDGRGKWAEVYANVVDVGFVEGVSLRSVGKSVWRREGGVWVFGSYTAIMGMDVVGGEV